MSMDSSVVSENLVRLDELSGQHETEELSDVESADGSMIEHPGTFQEIYSMSESPLFDYAPSGPDQVEMNGNAAFEETDSDHFSLDRFFKSPVDEPAQPLAPTLETPTPPKVEVEDKGPPSWNSFTNPLLGPAESPTQENGASSSLKSFLEQEKAGVSRASLIADVMSQNDISPGSSPASSPRPHYTPEKDSKPSVPVSAAPPATPTLVPRLHLSRSGKEEEGEVESPRVANTPPNLKVPSFEQPSSLDSMSRPLSPKYPHSLTRKALNGSTSPTVRAKPNVFDRLSAPSRPYGDALSPKTEKKPASPRQAVNSGNREKALERLAAPKSPRASPTRIASPRRSGFGSGTDRALTDTKSPRPSPTPTSRSSRGPAASSRLKSTIDTSEAPMTPRGSAKSPVTPRGLAKAPVTPRASTEVPATPRGTAKSPATPRGAAQCSPGERSLSGPGAQVPLPTSSVETAGTENQKKVSSILGEISRFLSPSASRDSSVASEPGPPHAEKMPPAEASIGEDDELHELSAPTTLAESAPAPPPEAAPAPTLETAPEVVPETTPEITPTPSTEASSTWLGGILASVTSGGTSTDGDPSSFPAEEPLPISQSSPAVMANTNTASHIPSPASSSPSRVQSRPFPTGHGDQSSLGSGGSPAPVPRLALASMSNSPSGKDPSINVSVSRVKQAQATRASSPDMAKPRSPANANVSSRLFQTTSAMSSRITANQKSLESKGNVTDRGGPRQPGAWGPPPPKTGSKTARTPRSDLSSGAPTGFMSGTAASRTKRISQAPPAPKASKSESLITGTKPEPAFMRGTLASNPRRASQMPAPAVKKQSTPISEKEQHPFMKPTASSLPRRKSQFTPEPKGPRSADNEKFVQRLHNYEEMRLQRLEKLKREKEAAEAAEESHKPQLSKKSLNMTEERGKLSIEQRVKASLESSMQAKENLRKKMQSEEMKEVRSPQISETSRKLAAGRSLKDLQKATELTASAKVAQKEREKLEKKQAEKVVKRTNVKNTYVTERFIARSAMLQQQKEQRMEEQRRQKELEEQRAVKRRPEISDRAKALKREGGSISNRLYGMGRIKQLEKKLEAAKEVAVR